MPHNLLTSSWHGYVYCVQCSYTAWSILSLLRFGHLSVCETLVRANAEVNSRDRKSGYTSLHLASMYVVMLYIPMIDSSTLHIYDFSEPLVYTYRSIYISVV